MKILEIFDSIQGEGSFMGRPCTFVRTAGCSLHCSFCDTKASWAEGSNDMSPIDIVTKCGMPFVVITGGEPTEQPLTELTLLIQLLQQAKKFVCIESNGTFEHYGELGADWVVCSPKAAAMYILFPAGVNELKYVVTEDFNDDVAIPEAVRDKFKGRIWLQPCDYGDYRTLTMCDKAYKIAMSDPRLRCGVQLHKLYRVQ